VITRITFPLSVPAMVSVAIYTFMIAWNEFCTFHPIEQSGDVYVTHQAVVYLPATEYALDVVMAASTIMDSASCGAVSDF